MTLAASGITSTPRLNSRNYQLKRFGNPPNRGAPRKCTCCMVDPVLLSLLTTLCWDICTSLSLTLITSKSKQISSHPLWFPWKVISGNQVLGGYPPYILHPHSSIKAPFPPQTMNIKKDYCCKFSEGDHCGPESFDHILISQVHASKMLFSLINNGFDGKNKARKVKGGGGHIFNILNKRVCLTCI